MRARTNDRKAPTRGRVGGAWRRSRRDRGRAPQIVAGAVATACILAGCGSSGSGGTSSSNAVGTPSHPVTITFANWADAETATQGGIQAMVNQFEATHPSIKVQMQPISFSDIGHELVLRVRSGNTPDVAELSGNDTYSLAEAGGLQPLDSFANAAYKSSVLPNELQQGQIQGKLMAIPWTDAPNALWYNKTILSAAGLNPQDPPTTMDQLVSDLGVIRQKEPKVVPLGLDTSNRDFALESNWPFMQTFGSTPFTGTTASADTPAMTSYLTFLRTLETANDIQPGKKIGDARPLAAGNEMAFTWDQPLLQGVIQSDNHMSDAQFYDTWGVAPLPTGPTGKSYSTELGHQMVMFKSSKHQAADWEFMNWLTTSPTAVLNYTIKSESSLPPLAHPDAQITGALNTPVYKAFSSAIVPKITRPGYGPTFEEAYPPIMAGIQSAVTTSTPPATIAKTMQSQLLTAFR